MPAAICYYIYKTVTIFSGVPCLAGQVKYLMPPMDPSFFPSGSSNSTPANVPPANSVVP